MAWPMPTPACRWTRWLRHRSYSRLRTRKHANQNYASAIAATEDLVHMLNRQVENDVRFMHSINTWRHDYD
jgi:hypothetical protein